MYRDLLEIAKRVRRSEGFKCLIATPKRLAVHAQQRRNDGIFAIEIYEKSGLFSILQMVVFILMYCEEHRRIPLISARGPIYGDREGQTDWFSALFEPTYAQPVDHAKRIITSRVHGLEELGFRQRYEHLLRIDSASRLFLSYYRPAPNIVDEVNATSRALGLGASTLGVHFRGTDKKIEAMTLSWEEFCRKVATTLHERPHLTSIFVSSDEQRFLDYFLGFPFGAPVQVAPARYLAHGELPVHFLGYPGLAIAREALVCCLLLAQCGFLLKTPSYLSAWSKIFNPSLPVSLTSPPRTNAFWFPDSQIWCDEPAYAELNLSMFPEAPAAPVEPAAPRSE